MAGVFSRSWDLTKTTLGVIRKDKELFAYSILSGFFSLAFLCIMFIPLLFVELRSFAISSNGLDALNIGFYFLVYFILFFIFTFFNFCIVYTAKKRFEGGNAKFFESIGFTLSKIHLVIFWSLLSASVSIVMKIIESFGRKRGKGINIIASIISWIIGTSWSLATIFTMPAIVYYQIGPFKAIGKSVQTLKKTWGESIIRYIGFGATEFILFFLGILVGAGLVFAGISINSISLIIVAVILVSIYFVFLISLFSIATMVFNTALFVYAETGRVPDGFNEDILKSAFKNTAIANN